MILGTAGHIDHGKTALIKALTGVDTDRLPEEKKRGITIELGFAPLVLDGVGVIGVVDVPGHEAFVRTMVAGASGVDLALLVIAADEGVMPQTREHLAILSILGIRAGLVVLTKADLVDAEWLALVTEDVQGFLEGSPLEGAPIIPASVVTGTGLAEVREAIGQLAARVPARLGEDVFRLPVDRSFSVRGTGTVVTGTVWSGQVRREDVVSIPPLEHAVRVRGIQVHGAAVDQAGPGTRAAIALAGVDVAQVPRGSMLVAGPSWQSTKLLRADVTLLDDAPAALGARTRVRFHLGTTDVDARVVAPGGPLQPGEQRGVRIVLGEPVVARAGDRFVLRSASPLATIGGGVITDPLPPHRRARPWPAAQRTALESLRLMLAEADTQGVVVAALPMRLGIPVSSVTATLAAERDLVVELGGRAYAAEVLYALSARLRDGLSEYHRKSPLETGASLQAVRSQLPGLAELVDEVIRRVVRAGEVELDGGIIRAHGWAPRLTSAQSALAELLADTLVKARSEPPSVAELQELHGDSVPHLLRFLERDGRLVQVEAERYYDPGAVTHLVDSLRMGMERNREYSPSELRELLGVSRKYLIPFLEFCDRRGVTERRQTGRVLHGT